MLHISIASYHARTRARGLKLFSDPATKPRQREVFIEFLRKGEVDEAIRAFNKIYLEVVHQIIDHLETAESANSPH
jgi:hypothetical protein